jgi:putative ABC transport system substrate-binding protein
MTVGLVVTLGVLSVPRTSDAQRSKQVPRIGFLSPASPGRPETSHLFDAFRQGLRGLGYVEGQNLTVEYRWTEGTPERLPDLAAELARLKVDLIVAVTVPAIRAAQRVTTTIPIVMVLSSDPVRLGLVASLARPGGTTTGLASLIPELGAKRLQLLKEAAPRASRFAVLWNPTNPALQIEGTDMQAAARTLGLTLRSFEVREAGELESALAAMTRERPDALVTVADSLTFVHRARIVEFAAKNRLPSMYGVREFVEAGGLMSYGTSVPDLFGRAAYYVDRILRGARPADLPVEQPTRFELVLNRASRES